MLALLAATAAAVAAGLLRHAMARRRCAHVTVCAWCRSSKRPGGHWARLERYTARHQPGPVSHGICEACVDRYFPESSLEATLTPAARQHPART